MSIESIFEPRASDEMLFVQLQNAEGFSIQVSAYGDEAKKLKKVVKVNSVKFQSDFINNFINLDNQFALLPRHKEIFQVRSIKSICRVALYFKQCCYFAV